MTNGTKEFGEYIKSEIQEWLEKNLKINLSPTKTKITNIRTTPALFLGFSFKTYIKYKYVKSAYGELSRRAGLPIIIDVDQQRLLDRLVIKKFCNKNHKPVRSGISKIDDF